MTVTRVSPTRFGSVVAVVVGLLLIADVCVPVPAAASGGIIISVEPSPPEGSDTGEGTITVEPAPPNDAGEPGEDTSGEGIVVIPREPAPDDNTGGDAGGTDSPDEGTVSVVREHPEIGQLPFIGAVIVGVVVGVAISAGVMVAQSEPEEGETEVDQLVNGLQTTLDILGVVPVIGIPADLTSAAISIARGDRGDAALSLMAAIPIAGSVNPKSLRAITRLTDNVPEAAELVAKYNRYTNTAAWKAIAKVDDLAKYTRIRNGRVVEDVFDDTGKRIGQYIYKIVDHRVVEVRGRLVRHTAKRPSAAVAKAIRESGQPGDQAAHLVAASLAGSRLPHNLVALNAHANQKIMAVYERLWRDMIEDGHEIAVTIRVIYDGVDDVRPSKLIMHFTVDGVPHTPWVVPNSPAAKDIAFPTFFAPFVPIPEKPDTGSRDLVTTSDYEISGAAGSTAGRTEVRTTGATTGEPTVTLAPGDLATDMANCPEDENCKWFAISLENFDEGPYEVKVGTRHWSWTAPNPPDPSNLEVWLINENATNLNRQAYYWHGGNTVWVSVNGIRSNDLHW